MDEEGYELLKKLVLSQGVNIEVFLNGWLDDNLERFDLGLRRQLYKDYDYKEIFRKLAANCSRDNLYVIEDVFHVFYIVFGGADLYNNGLLYIKIGPYLESAEAVNAAEVAKDNNLDLYHISILKDYYNALPVLTDFPNLVYTFICFFAGNLSYGMDRLKLEFMEEYQWELRIDEENVMQKELIEKRYLSERRLTKAIERGDLTEAFLVMGEMDAHQLEQRSEVPFRNAKNYMISLNVLCRKAVEEARVHPFYIDRLSSEFARRIEAAASMRNLESLSTEMIRRYCYLVRNHSMRGYSELVGNVIDYMELHLSESFEMGILAEKFCVSLSHLSSQFKKETGMTMTDYLGQKRILEAQRLLATTSLPIQEIGARVAIFDEGYFSRLFKKYRGITPREYRNGFKMDRKVK